MKATAQPTRIVYRRQVFVVQENRPESGIDHWKTIDQFENLRHATYCYPAATFDESIRTHQTERERTPHHFECSYFEPSECRICGIGLGTHRGGSPQLQRMSAGGAA